MMTQSPKKSQSDNVNSASLCSHLLKLLYDHPSVYITNKSKLRQKIKKVIDANSHIFEVKEIVSRVLDEVVGKTILKRSQSAHLSPEKLSIEELDDFHSYYGSLSSLEELHSPKSVLETKHQQCPIKEETKSGSFPVQRKFVIQDKPKEITKEDMIGRHQKLNFRPRAQGRIR